MASLTASRTGFTRISFRRPVLIAFGLLSALLIWLSANWPVWWALYGTENMRALAAYDWINQSSRLSWIQRKVVVSLLYRKDADGNTTAYALSILNAHISENEDEAVRHLSYLALTSKDPGVCEMALSGLQHVSAKNKSVAIAAFLYELKNVDPAQKTNCLILQHCIGGVLKYPEAYQEALPAVRKMTNGAYSYLMESAKRALIQMEERGKAAPLTRQ